MVIFFVISFLTNIIGALNPDFIHDFKLSLTLKPPKEGQKKIKMRKT